MNTTKGSCEETNASAHRPDKHLLVIDDDTLFCDAVLCSGMEEKFTVHTAHTALSGLDLCSRYKMDVVLLDQELPDRNGSEICSAILSRHDRTKIILATAYPDLGNAVVVIKLGAFDYLPKPFNIDELCFAVKRAMQAAELEQVAEVTSWKNQKEAEKIHFIGSSQAAKAVRNAALTAAGSHAPTLLSGPTGTGKTLLAQYIHSQSRLRDSMFLSVNCATLPENLIEAELFGVEKGAYTDAGKGRKGIFELAAGGTLFLDEIGTLPLHLQPKLLGVLDDGIVKRLGSETSRKVDVRILTATNTNLMEAVRRGIFREDLFYRLSVLNIELPTLPQRKDDMRELCAYFLGNSVAETISSREYSAMAAYSWPGNVRELKNILERTVLLHKGEELRPSQFLNSTAVGITQTSNRATDSRGNQSAPLCSLKEMEKEHISNMLNANNGNRSQTARSLDISRSTLIRKMKEYQL